VHEDKLLTARTHLRAHGQNRFNLLAATLALIWIGLGSNLIGLKVGKWTKNLGALATWGVGNFQRLTSAIVIGDPPLSGLRQQDLPQQHDGQRALIQCAIMKLREGKVFSFGCLVLLAQTPPFADTDIVCRQLC